ncbi:hypothetical protein CQ14_38700 [Bradyrhizobium lablabi]|uniref:Uncharacterized protein n=1 Tax=Bradyrhizobium lablabi TaxID=722472 RepID=A0A0R3M7Y6_9BRAD|nr:hypothetical protein [Bradyrhizobium lablabi]KRR16027.1 hypothetical protein CQ14_38700 [Bradyrhizobium lablabi]
MDPLDLAFDEIAAAMIAAAGLRKIDQAQAAAERHGLKQQGTGTPSQITDWQRSDATRSLRFRWRWYDPSQAFSIQPDINILTIELREGDQIIRQSEQRYEDPL